MSYAKLLIPLKAKWFRVKINKYILKADLWILSLILASIINTETPCKQVGVPVCEEGLDKKEIGGMGIEIALRGCFWSSCSLKLKGGSAAGWRRKYRAEVRRERRCGVEIGMGSPGNSPYVGLSVCGLDSQLFSLGSLSARLHKK